MGFQLLGGPYWVPLVYRVSLRGNEVSPPAGAEAGPLAGALDCAVPPPPPPPEQPATARQAAASRVRNLERFRIVLLLPPDGGSSRRSRKISQAVRPPMEPSPRGRNGRPPVWAGLACDVAPPRAHGSVGRRGVSLTQRRTGYVVRAAVSSPPGEVTRNLAVSPGNRVTSMSSTDAAGSSRSGKIAKSRTRVCAVTVTTAPPEALSACASMRASG